MRLGVSVGSLLLFLCVVVLSAAVAVMLLGLEPAYESEVGGGEALGFALSGAVVRNGSLIGNVELVSGGGRLVSGRVVFEMDVNASLLYYPMRVYRASLVVGGGGFGVRSRGACVVREEYGLAKCRVRYRVSEAGNSTLLEVVVVTGVEEFQDVVDMYSVLNMLSYFVMSILSLSLALHVKQGGALKGEFLVEVVITIIFNGIILLFPSGVARGEFLAFLDKLLIAEYFFFLVFLCCLLVAWLSLGGSVSKGYVWFLRVPMLSWIAVISLVLRSRVIGQVAENYLDIVGRVFTYKVAGPGLLSAVLYVVFSGSLLFSEMSLRKRG